MKPNTETLKKEICENCKWWQGKYTCNNSLGQFKSCKKSILIDERYNCEKFEKIINDLMKYSRMGDEEKFRSKIKRIIKPMGKIYYLAAEKNDSCGEFKNKPPKIKI